MLESYNPLAFYAVLSLMELTVETIEVNIITLPDEKLFVNYNSPAFSPSTSSLATRCW